MIPETESAAYGLALPQWYPYGLPEMLPDNAFNPALASSLVVFSGQCRVMGVSFTSTKGSSQFIQIFDASSVPADGAIPLISMAVSLTSNGGVSFTPGGRWFTRGCVVCNSSTQGSKTIGSADCLFDAQYIPQVI